MSDLVPWAGGTEIPRDLALRKAKAAEILLGNRNLAKTVIVHTFNGRQSVAKTDFAELAKFLEEIGVVLNDAGVVLEVPSIIPAEKAAKIEAEVREVQTMLPSEIASTAAVAPAPVAVPTAAPVPPSAPTLQELLARPALTPTLSKESSWSPSSPLSRPPLRPAS